MNKKSRSCILAKFSLSGFTLIELLVVISVIGFLSTLGVVSFTNARQKARDATRIADLRQIKNALEMYYNDNRSFPPATSNGKIGIGNNAIDIALRPYLPKTPKDPLGATDAPANSIHYYYYDASQACNGGEFTNAAIVFASIVEQTAGNPSKICTLPWVNPEIAAEGSANSYTVLAGPGQ